MSDEELQTIWRQSIDHYGKRMQSIVNINETGNILVRDTFKAINILKETK